MCRRNHYSAERGAGHFLHGSRGLRDYCAGDDGVWFSPTVVDVCTSHSLFEFRVHLKVQAKCLDEQNEHIESAASATIYEGALFCNTNLT